MSTHFVQMTGNRNTDTHVTMAPLHETCVRTQVKKTIKRKLLFNQSESRNKALHLIFLASVRMQVLCNRATVTSQEIHDYISQMSHEMYLW